MTFQIFVDQLGEHEPGAGCRRQKTRAVVHYCLGFICVLVLIDGRDLVEPVLPWPRCFVVAAP
jgi:hypothetical protein